MGDKKMIRKYRKKPIVIEAVQFKGNNESEIIEFTKSIALTRPECLKSMRIPTLEGDMIANIGDWIIKGVNGEFYPCKPDIFEKLYDLTEQEEDKEAEEWEIEKLKRL
jgi:hypothetical protein